MCDKGGFLFFIICLIACASFMSGHYAAMWRMKKTAIRHGAAQHNPQTGAFEWKGADGND